MFYIYSFYTISTDETVLKYLNELCCLIETSNNSKKQNILLLCKPELYRQIVDYIRSNQFGTVTIVDFQVAIASCKTNEEELNNLNKEFENINITNINEKDIKPNIHKNKKKGEEEEYSNILNKKIQLIYTEEDSNKIEKEIIFVQPQTIQNSETLNTDIENLNTTVIDNSNAVHSILTANSGVPLIIDNTLD